MAEKNPEVTEEVIKEDAVAKSEAVEEVVASVVEEVVAEPVAPVVEDLKYAAPVAVTREDIENYLPTPAGPAVVGSGEVDDVILSSCVYKNDANRRSLTVYHVQRRLIELELLKDGLVKAGYYGDLTKQAVAVFQANNGIPGDGLMDAVTFAALFEGDPSVRVSLN